MKILKNGQLIEASADLQTQIEALNNAGDTKVNHYTQRRLAAYNAEGITLAVITELKSEIEMYNNANMIIEANGKQAELDALLLRKLQIKQEIPKE